MNTKSKPAAKRNRHRIHLVKLSDKEMSTLREEHEDKNAAQRNIPMLREILIADPQFNAFLYDPALLPMLMARVIKDLSARRAFSGDAASSEQFVDTIAQQLLPQFNPRRLLNDFITIVKERKVKREKRVLLWAVGDLMNVVYQRSQPQQSHVFRAIVIASIDNATDLSKKANVIRVGDEPYKFSYEKFMDGQIDRDELKKLSRLLGVKLYSLHKIMSMWSLEIFQQIENPFGLRFHQVIHYPTAVPKKKSSLILAPGREEPPEDEIQTDEERYHNLIEALNDDYLHLPTQNLIKESILSIKAAGFGKIDPDEMTGLCNTVGFALLWPFADNPFLLRLYEVSGENAETINPEDEKQDIIEIKSSPDNPRAYLAYADRLLEKNEKSGAYRVYKRAAELMPDSNDELTQKLFELKEALDKEMLPQSAG